MKILIADKFQEAYLGELKSLGHEITLNPDIKANELPNIIKGYNVLIVRSKEVTKAIIAAADALTLIIRAGAGFNTIDVDAATKKGIHVCNTPGKNSIAVAELAFGLMLSIDRKIPDNVLDLRNSLWNKKKYSVAEGIYGKTLGIFGIGEIGQELAIRAKAFGMKILVNDPIAQQNKSLKISEMLTNKVFEFVNSAEELLKIVDIVSLHVPSTAQTKGMVNKEFLKHMRPNSILINTSRGNVIVDEDLIDAMNTKNIRAGLDVYNNECATSTGTFETPLSKHKNVYGTHHIGASTEQAQNEIAKEVIKILREKDKGIILHCVNMPKN